MQEKISDKKVLVKIRYRKLILPSTYDVSERDEFVLTMSACTSYGLALYTKEEWLSIKDGLFKASMAVQRYLIGNAEELVVEDGGIRISPILLDAAGLKREAIWIQCVNRVEICNPKFIDTLVFPSS